MKVMMMNEGVYYQCRQVGTKKHLKRKKVTIFNHENQANFDFNNITSEWHLMEVGS